MIRILLDHTANPEVLGKLFTALFEEQGDTGAASGLVADLDREL